MANENIRAIGEQLLLVERQLKAAETRRKKLEIRLTMRKMSKACCITNMVAEGVKSLPYSALTSSIKMHAIAATPASVFGLGTKFGRVDARRLRRHHRHKKGYLVTPKAGEHSVKDIVIEVISSAQG